MTDDTPVKELVIVRRRRNLDDDTLKSGVWKIAYADFMTAMMAFFLVMWLINSTDDTTRSGVARYFNPIQLSQTSPTPKGLSDPEDAVPPPHPAEPTETAETEPEATAAKGASDAPDRAPRYTEAALFQDPYAVLEEIVAAAAVAEPPADGGLQAPAGSGVKGGDAFKDPFDPLAWATPTVASATSISMNAQAAGPSGTPDNGLGGSGARAKVAAIATEVNKVAGTSENEAGIVAALATVGQGNIGAKAGSEQPTSTVLTSESSTAVLPAPKPDKPLAAVLAEALEAAGISGTVERVSDGTLISLTDREDFGMFAVGSAEPSARVVRLIGDIALALKDTPGGVVIRGHTDGRPFRTSSYDNWRLSSARAHMARHMLLRGGLDPRRIVRVEGHADHDLKVPADPLAAENRRIEILLLEGGSQT